MFVPIAERAGENAREEYYIYVNYKHVRSVCATFKEAAVLNYLGFFFLTKVYECKCTSTIIVLPYQTKFRRIEISRTKIYFGGIFVINTNFWQFC